ncbi:ATP synthase subunit H-domain-containing protein [Suillus subaureus]|uniref:ATP synthase subunit H-domain-containing protein n=1 Tax=Suillus subaureus TaxID=48587 RepID=A0A9P7E1F8_9AGAM|nr:ATP synthase subunit H-domain-containing protein [Suillus subaureus]KAG1808396.1 ATP synthase subunit H-domain-containing protein [Suillus subaureus]
MASVIPVIFILAIVLGLIACGYLFVPKGTHQTTIRTAIMLTLASCYLMWMVTYMAQLHPLISKSSNSLLWFYWLTHEPQRHIVR